MNFTQYSQNLPYTTFSGEPLNLVQYSLTNESLQYNGCSMFPPNLTGLQKLMSNLYQLDHDVQPKIESTSNYMRCYNKFCTSNSLNLKKVTSKGCLKRQNMYLCSICYQSYKLNNYCQYCEQIYSTTDQTDGDDQEWIECDLCQRWIHIDCEAKYSNKLIYEEREKQFQCHQCRGQVIKQKKQKKQSKKKSSIPSIHETYTNVIKDDPFVYDTQFNRKINRKPIVCLELDIVQKKSACKFNLKCDKCIQQPSAVLTVSKDGKQQLIYKLTLSEQEMKQDLLQIQEDFILAKQEAKVIVEENVHSQQSFILSDATIQIVEFTTFEDNTVVKKEIKEPTTSIFQSKTISRTRSSSLNQLLNPTQKQPTQQTINQKSKNPNRVLRNETQSIKGSKEKQSAVSSRTRKANMSKQIALKIKKQ